MKTICQFLLVLIFVAMGSMVFAAALDNIESRMSAEQFKKSGLHKLSGDELQLLNEWLKSQAGERASALSENVMKQAQTENEKKSFGIEHREEKKILEVSSTITNIRQTPYKKYILTLANEQVWEQKAIDIINFQVSDAVIIKRAIFGSFTLKHLKTGLTTKVKRRR